MKTTVINVTEVRNITNAKRAALAEYERTLETLRITIYNDILGTGRRFTAREISDMTGLPTSTITNLIQSMKWIARSKRYITRTFYEYKNGAIDFDQEPLEIRHSINEYYRTDV